MTLRSQFATTMYSLLEADERVCVLLGDIGVWSFRSHMERWPARVLNVGVAECGMVGMAAGLAMAGLYPVVSTIESFLLRRAYEFLALDFGLQKLGGLFVGVGGENEYAKLGPTHQCYEGHELALRAGMDFHQPKSEPDVHKALTSAVRERRFAYVRLEEVA